MKIISRVLSSLPCSSRQTGQLSLLTRTMATDPTGKGRSIDTKNLVVEHAPESHKFLVRLGEDEAKLEYSVEKGKDGQVVWDMWHTEVPSQLQGKGIAKILAKEAFDHVAANNLKMHLSCSYLQKYMEDNPLDKYKSALV